MHVQFDTFANDQNSFLIKSKNFTLPLKDIVFGSTFIFLSLDDPFPSIGMP